MSGFGFSYCSRDLGKVSHLLFLSFLTFLSFFPFLLHFVYVVSVQVYVCAHVYVMISVWKLEDYFHSVGSGVQTQILRLGSKHPYRLGQPTAVFS